MSMPENVVFSVKDANQALRYLSFTGDQKLLRFGAEEGVFSVTAKFAIEPASANGLFHIRSCYDNHYWVRYSVSEPWLSASAPKPVEDQSKEDCTLFRPEMSSDKNFVTLRHMRSGLNVVMRPAGDANAYTLCVQQSPPTQFGCINYGSLGKLHKYLLIKGHNVRCLAVRTIQNKQFIQIESDDPTDPASGFETFVTKNGNIRIKSLVSGKFWCLDPSPNTPPGWILVDYAPESSPTNPNTLFEVIRSPIPSLRCLGNNNFCKRITSGGVVSCLAAYTQSPEDQSIELNFINLGHSNKSQVTVKSFRHPRVYNTKTEELTNQVLENRKDQPLVAYIGKDGHIHTTKQTFSNSVNLGLGNANFFSPIPFLSENGQVAIPVDGVSFGFKVWGRTYDSSSLKDVVRSYVLPARTRVTASLIAKTATCEVPFSYQVSDEFYGGGSAIQNLDDGVFTGVYTYATEVRIDLVVPLSTQQGSDEQVSVD